MPRKKQPLWSLLHRAEAPRDETQVVPRGTADGATCQWWVLNEAHGPGPRGPARQQQQQQQIWGFVDLLSLPAGCSLFFHNHLLSGRTEVRGAARQVGQSLTGARKRRGASHTASSQTPPPGLPSQLRALGCSPHGDPRGCGESSRPHPHQAWLTYLPTHLFPQKLPRLLINAGRFSPQGRQTAPGRSLSTFDTPGEGWLAGSQGGGGGSSPIPCRTKRDFFLPCTSC